MKKWTIVKLKEQDKEIDQMARSLSNYLYKNGPINDIYRKYNIEKKDRIELNKYTCNRIAGIMMLYLSKDSTRINDILNHYYSSEDKTTINPELETYIER